MAKKILSFIFVFFFLFLYSKHSSADDFLATRTAIIHEQDNSTSQERGRLSQGNRVPVLEHNANKSYYKIKTEADIEGWVSKRRGRIIYTQTTTPSTTTYNFYFGNLHSHVSELSGEGNIPTSTFAQAFTYAMNEGNLDFMAITIHNHLAKAEAYSKLQSVSNNSQYNKPGTFVPIAGQEFSSISKGNHINVFEADAWINPTDVPNGEFKNLYETWIPAHSTQNTSLQFNHPYSTKFTAKSKREYGRDDYKDNIQDLREATDSLVSTIEILSANSHHDDTDKPHFDENTTRVNAYLFALNEGWHLAPTANQDNHRKNWGTATESRTACIAKELKRDDVLTAIKERRCYATEDENMKVTFKAGNHWMGSIIDLNEISGLYIKIEDNEEPSAIYTVRLYMDEIGNSKLTINSQPLQTYTLDNNEEVIYPINNPEPDTYYFLRVTQSNTSADPNNTEDDAWTAPIWISEIAH